MCNHENCSLGTTMQNIFVTCPAHLYSDKSPIWRADLSPQDFDPWSLMTSAFSKFGDWDPDEWILFMFLSISRSLLCSVSTWTRPSGCSLSSSSCRPPSSSSPAASCSPAQGMTPSYIVVKEEDQLPYIDPLVKLNWVLQWTNRWGKYV